jgi:hypothetical protein
MCTAAQQQHQMLCFSVFHTLSERQQRQLQAQATAVEAHSP